MSRNDERAVSSRRLHASSLLLEVEAHPSSNQAARDRRDEGSIPLSSRRTSKPIHCKRKVERNQRVLATKERRDGRETIDGPKNTPPIIGLPELPSIRIDNTLLPVEPVSLGIGLGRSSGFEPGVLRMRNSVSDELASSRSWDSPDPSSG